MWILVNCKISKADWSMLERLLLLHVYSQATQCNEDLIACSVLLSVISFGIVFSIQPCLK